MSTQLAHSLESSSITLLRGIGPKTQQALAKIHIFTLQDLLLHLPYRYENRTCITPIQHIQQGDRVLVEGEVVATHIIGRRASLVCRIADETGEINLRFFHFNAQQRQQLNEENVRIRCFGEVRANFQGALEMVHPEYRVAERMHELGLSDRLTPIYPVTKGLQQNSLRKLVKQALAFIKQQPLPEFLNLTDQPSLQEAIVYVHEPPVDADQTLLQKGEHPMQQRLALEELLAHELSFRQLRHKIRRHQAQAFTAVQLQQALLEQLPFTLTAAQQRVVAEVNADLAKPVPMLRLVQGDVGSGKTIIAACAVLAAIEAGCQAVVMAPTEILAEQHRINFKKWLEPLGVRVGWLVSAQKAKERQETLSSIANGELQCVIGTHALFQQQVEFNRLALIVVDEQHRFGVHQRLALREKGRQEDVLPHQLIMTATPIPRTLAMTAYADLDCSVIDELPPGRKPIKTLLVNSHKREQILQRVRANCLEARQVYWVCTLIDESEALQCQAAENTATQLQQWLPDVAVGLVHGRMKTEQKEQTMQRFKQGEIQLLVATTVIEVGVDVPNASLMVIENPERLGLAQLHQLRGRVGRGTAESFCVMLYQTPLGEIAKERLQIMRDHTDGFKIAEEDLRIRGPGEILGARQAGVMQFKIADLVRDQLLIMQAKELAAHLQENPRRVEAILNRWLKSRSFYTDA